VLVSSDYSAYFDATYSREADPQTLVAGIVSSAEQWAQWEIEWRLTLAKFNVPYFHMREFNSFKKAFSLRNGDRILIGTTSWLA
jgi:hypothetical protein